jgi:hypothetical protein
VSGEAHDYEILCRSRLFKGLSREARVHCQAKHKSKLAALRPWD